MPKKEYGDVVSTFSLAHYFARHALDHPDVDNARTVDNVLFLCMADGSEVTAHFVSNYKEEKD